jgi:hypothetical protein
MSVIWSLILSFSYLFSFIVHDSKNWKDVHYFLIQATLIAWLKVCQLLLFRSKNAGKYPSALTFLENYWTIIDKAKVCIKTHFQEKGAKQWIYQRQT